MDILKAAFLGIIEGLTEFLPVSSTAHLLISSYLINFNAIDDNLFEIVIQFGAILAICVLYYRRIFDVLLKFKEKSQQQFIINLILAFLPAAVIGFIFHKLIKALFFNNLTIAISLILGGIAIILIEKRQKRLDCFVAQGAPRNDGSEGGAPRNDGGNEGGAPRNDGGDESGASRNDRDGDEVNIKPKTAFLIGCFQALAMIPGVSRSGATIMGGILLGLKRKTATEFSFFLAIPTIAAASFYDLLKNYSTLTFQGFELILIGLLTSFISAILVIKWFVAFVSKNDFTVFGIYRIILGLVILLFI
jgi:undecaprenyl-diphosphatase